MASRARLERQIFSGSLAALPPPVLPIRRVNASATAVIVGEGNSSSPLDPHGCHPLIRGGVVRGGCARGCAGVVRGLCGSLPEAVL